MNIKKSSVNLEKCYCCGTNEWKVIPNTSGGSYGQCNKCGHQIQLSENSRLKTNQFTEEQKKYYDEDSICFSPLFLSLQQEATNKRLKIIKNFLSEGKIIEVGPGSGESLLYAKSLGYEVFAIEQSETLAKAITNRHNIKVEVGAFEEKNLHDTYDAYMSFHVIEHVTDVIAHLNKASSIVRDEGYAFIATPNARSWEHKFSSSLSPNYSTAHFQLFSSSSLSLCLESAGWRVIKVMTPEYTTSWLRVLTAVLRKTKNSQNIPERGTYVKSSNQKIVNLVLLFGIITKPVRFIQEHLMGGNELFIIAQKIKLPN